MASGMPGAVPPRISTPITDDEDYGLAPGPVDDGPPQDFYDPHRLSVMIESPQRNGYLKPRSASHASESSVESTRDIYNNPFNFQTVTYTAGSLSPAKSNVGQRRGHKYKHSSVSHQIFLEPTPRAPLQLPASLPIPTLTEGWTSMSRDQTLRASWCLCHVLIAGYVQWNSHGSLAMTALSHLIFYDASGAILCAVVDVLSNFEVWKRTSIRHPFGLERTEVLVGFAMSILLLFMGFDLITHGLHHSLEGLGGHVPHHEHSHERVSAGRIDIVSSLAIISTLVSAIMLQNHQRIARAMRFAALESLPSILNNPSHLLTLSCSALLILLPRLSSELYNWLDRCLAGAIALAMLILGSRLVWNLGSILLLSYSSPGVSSVKRDIEKDPSVVAVEEASFWQVHYGLCLANIRLRVRGTEDSLAKLRERLASLVRHRLGGSYGAGGQKWEVSIQMTLETD